MSRERNPMFSLTAVLAAGAIALSSVSLLGCGKEEPPPPPPPPPRPVAQAPEPLRAEEIVTDPRVQFPQQYIPVDESLARAVANFAANLAAGDRSALEASLDAPSRATLDLLVDSGQWTGATSAIQVVRIVRLDPAGDSAQIGLAIQDSRGAYLTGWKAQSSGGAWVFGAMPSPPRTAMTAAHLDGASLVELVAETPKQDPRKPAEAAPEEQAVDPDTANMSFE